MRAGRPAILLMGDTLKSVGLRGSLWRSPAD